MHAFRHHVFSEEEYLFREREVVYKSEYWQGGIFAVAGGSFRHNRVCSRMNRLLSVALDGKPCQPSSGDQRMMTPGRLYTYPDAAVYCGKIAARPGTTDVATNPTVLVEVLSNSTHEYDMGDKLAAYKLIPSLQHVVFVEPDDAIVTVVSRKGARWHEVTVTGLAGRFALPGIGVEIEMSALYEGIVGPEGAIEA